MKKLLLAAALGACAATAMADGGIEIDGTVYRVDTLIEQKVGPGTLYRRLRLPQYPLNVNMLQVDLKDPSVRVETTQAGDMLFGTERLVDAADRQSVPGHRAFAGANGNFWCVSQSYPYSDWLLGTTFNANLRNGVTITETNCAANQWDSGPEYIGEVGITPEGKVFSDHFRWQAWFSSDATGVQPVQGVNKLVHGGEVVMYNRYYGATRPMRCADLVWRANGLPGYDLVHDAATMVRLRFAPGQAWSAGRDMVFEVIDVTDNVDMPEGGDCDLVLMGRDGRRDALRSLAPGDAVTVNNTWTTLDGTPVEFDNMIGGNGQVMIDGQLTRMNTVSGNCALVYSKTGYGSSADHNMLYIIVIDKATDPVYGASAGCTSAVMCQIARHYGCANLTNFDSGGSAQMFVTDRIVNKTTEGTPRAVANGMLVYATSPEDNDVASIAFAERTLRVPTYATSAPVVYGYDKYGVLIDRDLQGVVFEPEANIGTAAGDGHAFVAAATGGMGLLTARYGGASVTKAVQIVEAEFDFAVPVMVVDQKPEPLFLKSVIDGNGYVYKPADAVWTIETEGGADPPVAIDADGCIVALAEGSARVTVAIGDRTATLQVLAQPNDGKPEHLENKAFDPAEWSVTKSGTGTPVLSAGNGEGLNFGLAFNVTTTRGPRVTVAKDIVMHSTPQYLYVTVDTGDKPLAALTLNIQTAGQARAQSIVMTPSEDGGNTYEAELWTGERDISVFPITFKSLQFTPLQTGQHNFAVSAVKTAYTRDAAVHEIVADSMHQGPAVWYDLHGRVVDGATAPAGVYIMLQGGKATKTVRR